MRPRTVVALGGVIVALFLAWAAGSTIGQAQGGTPPPYNIATCVAASPEVDTVLGTPVVTHVRVCSLGSPVPDFTPPVGTPAACAATPAPQPMAAATVATYEMCFAPDALTIPANTDVTLTVANRGRLPHTFTVDALRVNVVVGPGQTKRVTTHAKPGTYQFYDGVPGHREAGLVGTLTVR
jgi:plastocyanin